jgi:AP2-like factor, ANT lineage
MITAAEEKAAEAYDTAAIKFRGANAVINFEMNKYDVETIMKSSLPVGGAAKRLKHSLESEQKASADNDIQKNNPQQSVANLTNTSSSNYINYLAIEHQQLMASVPYGIPYDSNTAYYHYNLFQHFHASTNDGAAESAMPPTSAEFYLWPKQFRSIFS